MHCRKRHAVSGTVKHVVICGEAPTHAAVRVKWWAWCRIHQTGSRAVSGEFYEGWHHPHVADTSRLDTAKSEDLLRAGWLVARLRERPLPTLGLTHPGYAEFQVHSTTHDPDGVLQRVHTWRPGRRKLSCAGSDER